MQFSDRGACAADGVSLASGALAAVLSLVGVHLQNGGAARLEITRHMLAPLFDPLLGPIIHPTSGIISSQQRPERQNEARVASRKVDRGRGDSS